MLRARDGRLRLGWRLLVYVVVAGGVSVLVGGLLPRGIVGASVAVLAGGLAGGWVGMAMEGRRPAELGLRPHGAPGAFLGGVGIGLGLTAGTVGLMALVGGLSWVPAPGGVTAWARLGAETAMLLLVPALAEEVLIRGYPLQALASAWGAPAALGVTGLVFGAGHLSNPGVTPLAAVNVTLAGILLGILVLRTGTLWGVVGAHLGWNWGVAFLAGVPVSGIVLREPALFRGVPRGPGWLGGGEFGPEGSVAATVVWCGVAVWAWRSPRLRPAVAPWWLKEKTDPERIGPGMDREEERKP